MEKKAKVQLFSLLLLITLLAFIFLLMKYKWDINLLVEGLFGKK